MDFPVRLFQMNSGEDVMTNTRWIAERLSPSHPVMMAPENALFCGRTEFLRDASQEIRKRALGFLMEELKRNAPNTVLILGGVVDGGTTGSRNKKFQNRWVEIRRTGIRWGYSKIHLFKSNVPGQRSYDESLTFKPGKKVMCFRVPYQKRGVQLGAAVCFDLRFPQHFQALRRKGADVLCVPSAFTQKTGEAHWHTLLRTRAIENQCFVLAPAQVGSAPGDRQAFGHSLVVDPWGVVLADGKQQVGVVDAVLNLDRLREVRAAIALHE